VDAFFAAARDGDFKALVSVLDREVVVRSDAGPGRRLEVRGATAVAGRALMFADPERELRPVLVNGGAGVVVLLAGHPVTVMGFTVSGGHIVAIDSLSDPQRIGRLDLSSIEA
jgi:RNA polymerase sigma-70 factor (ECF subfamily)